MSLIDTILGRPLASNEAGEQRIGPTAGVPTFGLDALSSAAYGPEAALTVLLPLGAAGLTLIDEDFQKEVNRRSRSSLVWDRACSANCR
jgi:hypothetical protein